jgi:hypothetical protein
VKQEIHHCDLKKPKRTTRGTWNNQHTTIMDLGGKKCDEHANVRDGDGTTPTSLMTYKKTMHSGKDSHAQRKTTTTPKAHLMWLHLDRLDHLHVILGIQEAMRRDLSITCRKGVTIGRSLHILAPSKLEESA